MVVVIVELPHVHVPNLLNRTTSGPKEAFNTYCFVMLKTNSNGLSELCVCSFAV